MRSHKFKISCTSRTCNIAINSNRDSNKIYIVPVFSLGPHWWLAVVRVLAEKMSFDVLFKSA